MNTLIWGTRLAWGEWRAGKWTVLFLALILAVTAVTAQYFFSEKLQQSLNRQAAINLGGDLVVTSSQPIPLSWNIAAKKMGLDTAEVLSFSTVLSAGQKLQFASVQAVSNTYPLIGPRCSDSPVVGTVWLDKRLASNLILAQDDFVQIGAAKFKAVINSNQNQNILSGLSFAPHAMMNLADVKKTQIIIPGSQVEYKLLLTGNIEKIKDFKTFLKPQLQPNQKLLDIHNQRLSANNILTRANQYLALAMILCLLISGVALFIGAQHYLEQQQYSAALLRCLGLKQKDLLKIFSWQLLWIAFITSILGFISGYGLYFFFIKLLHSLLPLDMIVSSVISLIPMLLSVMVSMLLLTALALPVFIKLSQVPVISLWRPDQKLDFDFSVLSLILIALIFYGLCWLLIPDIKFIAALFSALILITIILSICLDYFFRLFKYIFNNSSGVWRQGGLNLLRYHKQSKLQMMGFSVVIAAILLLYSVRTDLFSQWQSDLPVNTPNYFAINIAPDQIVSIQKSLSALDINDPDFYPMVRGRLTQLNHRPILQAVPVSAQNQNALHRELNLSWMSVLPSDNKIVRGQWWNASSTQKPLISIEKNLADTLEIKLGDDLTFQIADQQLTGKVTNFRALNWTSFHPNFYIIFPPGVLEKFPTTYITSFYLSSDKVNQLNLLSQQFPNMTLIDASQILQQAKMILDQSSQAMQYAFVLTLLSGVLLLMASLQTTLSARQQSYRIMRILGASRYYLSGSLCIEFCLTGLLAGFIGTLCAILASWAISHFWLHINYRFQLSIWLWGSILGLGCLTFPALVFMQKILKIPPLLKRRENV